MPLASVLHSQDGTMEYDVLVGVVATADGNLVMSGHTAGDYNGTLIGVYDYVAVKLNPDGAVVWRYQVGCALM